MRGALLLLLVSCADPPSVAKPVVVIAPPALDAPPVTIVEAPAPDASLKIVKTDVPERYSALPEACRGPALRVEAVRRTCKCERKDRCGFDDVRDVQRLAAGLEVTATAPGEAAGGESVDVTVRAVNTSKEWLLVMLDAEQSAGFTWKDESGRPLAPVQDKTCKQADSVTLMMIGVTVVALPPGGAIEDTITARTSGKRQVGRSWKARNAVESAAIKDLDGTSCATIDDAPLKKGTYYGVTHLPFWPEDARKATLTRFTLRVR